jgi:hypothetical protein
VKVKKEEVERMGVRQSNRGSEYYQNKLHACMEISK